MKWLKTLFLMIVFFFVIHFSLQNRDSVTLRYSIQSYQWFEFPNIPVFMIILCSIFLGVLIGGISEMYGRYKLKKSLRQSKITIERLERELNALKLSEIGKPSILKEEIINY